MTANRPVGMLPHPMARCLRCDNWSYLAAVEDLCLECQTKQPSEAAGWFRLWAFS